MVRKIEFDHSAVHPEEPDEAKGEDRRLEGSLEKRLRKHILKKPPPHGGGPSRRFAFCRYATLRKTLRMNGLVLILPFIFIFTLNPKEESFLLKPPKKTKIKKSKIRDELISEVENFFAGSRELRKKLCEVEQECHYLLKEVLNGSGKKKTELKSELKKVKAIVSEINKINFF